MISCNAMCVKYTFSFANGIFALTGMMLVGAGVVNMEEVKKYIDFIKITTIQVPFVLIPLGAFIFLISFFGCAGAIKQNCLMLMMFALLLFALMALQITIAVFIIYFESRVTSLMKDALRESIVRYNEFDQEGWEMLQSGLQCCGVDSSFDWDTNEFFATQEINGTRPSSCCERDSSDFCYEDNRVGALFREGCLQILIKIVKGNFVVLMVALVVVLLTELSGLIMALYLVKEFRKVKDQTKQQQSTKVFVNSNKEE